MVPAGTVIAAAGHGHAAPGSACHSGYATSVLPWLIVIGLGIGLVMPTAMSLATGGIRTQDAGVGSAAVNTMQQIGGSIGTALLNTLAASAATAYLHGKQSTPAVQAQAQLHGYATAYWWSAGLFLAAAIIALLLYRKASATAPADAQAVHMGHPARTARHPGSPGPGPRSPAPQAAHHPPSHLTITGGPGGSAPRVEPCATDQPWPRQQRQGIGTHD